MFSLGKKESYSLSCVVTDTAVSVTVFEISSKNPQIIYRVIKQHPIDRNLTLIQFTQECYKLLEDAFQALRTAGFHSPEKINIILSPAWSFSQSRTVLLKRSKEFTVTEDIIKEARKKELQRLKNDDFAQYIGNGEELECIEDTVSHVMLNGYSLGNPIGKKVNDLQISFFITLVSKEFIEQLKHITTSVFNEKHTPVFHSLALCQGDFARKLHVTTTQTIISIENEITHIKIFDNDILQISRSIPIGIQSLLRHLRQQKNFTEKELMSYIELYKNNHLHDEEQKIFHEKIYNAGKKFRIAFEDALNELSKKSSVSKNCMIIGDEKISWLAEDSLSHLNRKLSLALISSKMIPVGYKKSILKPNIFDLLSVYYISSV
ncbi:MAG: DNA-binding XRE family transcriptional regulator [Flavobacteriaceae bacterium]|jgi:DNA-binding XRE family transcriptional regulator